MESTAGPAPASASTTTATVAAPYRAKLPYFDSLSWFQCVACRKWRIADFEMAHSKGKQWHCQDAFWSDEFQTWSNKCQFQQDKPVTCINPHPLARNHLEIVYRPVATTTTTTTSTTTTTPAPRPASSGGDEAAKQRARAALAANKPKNAPQQQQVNRQQQQQPQSSAFLAPLPNKSSNSAAFNEFWFLQFVTGVNKRLTDEGLSVPLRSCTDIILNENSSPMLCYNAFEEIKRWLRGDQALEQELREIMRTHPHSSNWQ